MLFRPSCQRLASRCAVPTPRLLSAPLRPTTSLRVARLCTKPAAAPVPPVPPPRAASNPFWAAIALYEVALEARPLLTKSVTSGVLYGAGDALAQVRTQPHQCAWQPKPIQPAHAASSPCRRCRTDS